MAQDSEGLSAMLAFLGQGGDQGAVNLPQMQTGMPQLQQLAMPNMQMPQQSGSLSGILGNLVSGYLSHKLNKHIETDEAKEAAKEYGPIITQLAGSSQDPRHKETYSTIGALVNSGNPLLSKMGLAAHQKIMDQDAQLTNEQRNFRDPSLRSFVEQELTNKGVPTDVRAVSMAYPGLKLGSPEFADQLIQYRKSSAFGSNDGQMLPATAEQKATFGIPASTPATYNVKNGDVVAHPINVTEDQGKSGTLAAMLGRARVGMTEALQQLDTSPTTNKKDFMADVISGLPFPGAEGIGNTGKSEARQVYETHAAAAETAMVHLLSGQGFTAEEAKVKAKAAIPGWGDSDRQKLAKLEVMRGIEEDSIARSGPGTPTKVREAAKLAESASPTKAKEAAATRFEGRPKQEFTLDEINAELKRRGL